MKKSTENALIILSLIFCLLIFAGGFLYTKLKLPQEEPIAYPSKIELRVTIDNYIQSQQYNEALNYLEEFKKTKDSKFLGLINYYLTKVKYQRLDYLSNESKWEEFHRYKKIYLHDMLKEADIVLTNLSKTEYALYVQYLRYWVYNLLYIDVKRDKAFETFRNMLDEYCQSNKEYAIVKEYTLRLYKDNKIQLAKQLNAIYLKYLKKYLPQDTVKYKLKSYANTVFNQGNYYSAKDIYKEYLKLEEDEFTAQIALKEIIDRYLKAGQFYPAKEFAKLAVNKYPDSYLEDYFQLKLAQCYFEMEEPQKSKEIYYKLLTEYPESRYKDDALCQLLDEITFYSFRNRKAAIDEINKLEIYTSNLETKVYLLINVADIYYSDKQYEKALDAYNDISERYSDSIYIQWTKQQIEKCKEKLKEQDVFRTAAVRI